MQIPKDSRLYYISELQLRRLKLVSASVAREIENQQYLTDREEERIKEEVARENQELTEQDTKFDEEQDQSQRDSVMDDLVEHDNTNIDDITID